MRFIGQYVHSRVNMFHDDVIKWKHFPRSGPLRGEFTGNQWIPLTKASDTELWCFLWFAPEQPVSKQSSQRRFETTTRSWWRHGNVVGVMTPISRLSEGLWHSFRSNENKATICSINTLRLRQNSRRFADDIFKCIFLNENVWISNKISLKFISEGPIINIPALVQIMAWRRPGDKPLSEKMMVTLMS